MICQELEILANQIGYKELHYAKFKLYNNDKDMSIILKKGQKYMKIKYNKGADLYDITTYKIKGLAEIKEQKENKGIFAEDLKNIIQEFFKFEYVFDKLGLVKK